MTPRERLKRLRAEQAERTRHAPKPPPLPSETVAELRRQSADLYRAIFERRRGEKK